MEKIRPKQPEQRPEEDGNTYPDLFLAINMLENRKVEAPADRVPLLDKWLQSLKEVNKEMRHLERIEAFSNILKNPAKHKEKTDD